MCCGGEGKQAASEDSCTKQKWSTASGTCFPKAAKGTCPARQSLGILQDYSGHNSEGLKVWPETCQHISNQARHGTHAMLQ